MDSRHPNIERLNNEGRQRKIYAFVVTASTCFILGCLIWPLTSKGFVTKATIPVQIGETESSQQEFQNRLVGSVGAITNDDFLTRVLDKVRSQKAIRNPDFEGSNFEAIRDSLSVAATPIDDDAKVRIQFAYNGNGTDDEKTLVKLVAEQFTMSLASSDPSNAIANNSLDSNREQIEQINWMVAQMESDLSDAKRTVAALQTNSDVGSQKDSPFRNASYPSNTNANVNLADIQNSIESIDVQSIRESLNTLANDISDPNNTNGLIEVNERSLVTEPINGSPTGFGLILVGLVSIVLGGSVAIRYQPFADRGFEDVSRVASSLQIPVVAVLNEKGSSRLVRQTSWANTAVDIARLVLLALLIVTIGFCIVDSGVRQSILTNPFHGISRMIWIFVGN